MTKIRVRLGAAEAEVEADPEHLREAIDLVPELTSKLPRQARDVVAPEGPGREAAGDGAEPAAESQIPAVSLDKGDSLADVIGKFFSSPWGRERRKLSDVREALQSYGLNYPKQSVAVALLRLAKTTRLRRFKAEDGEFVYTSASTPPSLRQSPEEQAVGELAVTEPN
ncbi:MAG: hypothetical protein JRN08_02825 [Nitrososphaerota archaeon]|nr:hypothetical protein [Nitrososphaerota archaeon]